MSGRKPHASVGGEGADPVERLAAGAGLALEWQDAHSRMHQVPRETLAALLAALGLPCETRADTAQSLAKLEAEHNARKLPPLITAQCHGAIALPGRAVKASGRYRIELESGGIIEGRVSLPKGEAALLAPIAEPGYHTLVLHDEPVCLAVAPRHCHTVADACREAGFDTTSPARLWGIGSQLYGLRRSGDGGVGDYSALAAFATKAARYGAHALAISPTHAMFSAAPEKFSPYSPSSRLFLNVAHIDPAAVLGRQALLTALEASGTTDVWATLESAPLIDWPRAASVRLAVLRALFGRFCASERAGRSALAAEFDAFCAEGGSALENHARFEALDAWQRNEHERNHWREWPGEFADPRAAAVDAFAREHRREVDFHLFAQWLAAKGLNAAHRAAREAGMAIGLVADLAVGCDGAGSHAWSYPAGMLQRVSVGAPPDLFNQAGQAWGLTTFSPRAMRTQGFRAFIDMLRAAFAYAGGIRIDHVLGLQRLWLVPEGERAKDGAYLAYPLADLLRLVALESWRHRAIVIGEDLGTVPPGFREQLIRQGLLGMRVLWFERDEVGGFRAPAQWGDDAMATTTTHDLPTVAGWWQGHDITWRHRIGQTAPRADGGDPLAFAATERSADRHALWQAFQRATLAPDDVDAPPPAQAPVDEALRYVASTPSPLVIYPLEDLLGLAEQPNLPGSIDEHPNWRRRVAAPIDALFADPAFADRLFALGRARGIAPSSPPASKPSRTS